jgi:hypothetical protein
LIKDFDNDQVYQKVKYLVDNMADGKIHPSIVYRELLAMKKVEEPAPADSTAAPTDSTTSADTTAAVSVDTTTSKVANAANVADSLKKK